MMSPTMVVRVRGRRCEGDASNTPAANKPQMMHERWESLRHAKVGVAGLRQLHRRITGASNHVPTRKWKRPEN